jgi:putative SOS response-associated peptidase YedK
MKSHMWKDSFLKRRCLIPVDSFVEWQVEGKHRLPWLYAMATDEPFALGGVWSHWRSQDGKIERNTFAIITVEPNELIERTTHHDRMPLIVKKVDWQRWLEPGSYQQPPLDLLRPFDADQSAARRHFAAETHQTARKRARRVGSWVAYVPAYLSLVA